MDTGNSRREQLRRIALIVQYDGTTFNGWQVQDAGITVQGELEKALFILTKEEIRVVASGRTDSGVHAIGQIVHFDLKSKISLQRICIGLNGILPFEIAIKNAFEVPSDFHARYSAVERIYRYYIYNSPQRNPFMKYRALWVKDIIDRDYIDKTAQFLVGEHDFASFCKKKSAEEKTIRRINAITVDFTDSIFIIEISGNAFLHNMIRIIIGTMIEMHKEKRNPEYIIEIINKKDRNASGMTAPAYGLYLAEVKYNPHLYEMKSGYR